MEIPDCSQVQSFTCMIIMQPPPFKLIKITQHAVENIKLRFQITISTHARHKTEIPLSLSQVYHPNISTLILSVSGWADTAWKPSNNKMIFPLS
jgi:hypothetical protein